MTFFMQFLLHFSFPSLIAPYGWNFNALNPIFRTPEKAPDLAKNQSLPVPKAPSPWLLIDNETSAVLLLDNVSSFHFNLDP